MDGEEPNIKDSVEFIIEQIERWIFSVSTRSFSYIPYDERPLIKDLEWKLAVYIIKDCCFLLELLKDKPVYADNYKALKESYDELRKFIYLYLQGKQGQIEDTVRQLSAVDTCSTWSFPLR